VAGSQIRAVASPLAVARGPVRGEPHPIHGPGVADEGTGLRERHRIRPTFLRKLDTWQAKAQGKAGRGAT
jgi:hypothetical protein